MSIVDSFLSSTLNTVDAVIGHFVSTAYANFIEANAGLITLLFTFYVMVLGYRFLYHHHHFNMSDVIRHFIVMICVYALVMNWKLYHLFVYQIFTTEPGNIAQILVNTSGHLQAESSIARSLDNIYESILHAAVGLFGEINFSIAGLAFIFYAILIFLIGTLMCVFALLLFIYAKMMMAIMLALGPIFITFILWDATKGLFSAWLNQLITIALIPIITSAILVLMLSVINVTLPHLNQPVEQLQFYGIAPFLGLALATTLLLAQVFRICSALGGGITLSSISTGAAIAASVLQKSGVAGASRYAGNWLKNKMRGSKPS
jgi:type IV secretion system protein VirB6